MEAVRFIGIPEGKLALAQAAMDRRACTFKSNAIDRAYAAAAKDVEEHGPLPVPL